MTARSRPYGSSNFTVEWDGMDPGLIQAGFLEVHLPSACIETIQYRSGNHKTNESLKMPGGVHYENVILKRGVIGSGDLYEWWNEVRNGSVDHYRSVTIRLLSEDRSSRVMEWRLLNAWPVRYYFSQLDAQNSETLVETIELAYERFEAFFD